MKRTHTAAAQLESLIETAIEADDQVGSPELTAGGLSPDVTEPGTAEPVEPLAAAEPSDGMLHESQHIDPTDLKPILEALLFVSQEPLTLERGMTVLGVSRAELAEGFRQLREEYDASGRALQLVELAGGFRMVTRSEYAPWLKRLEKIRPAPKLSRSALESLAIIAYKQPIVRSEIEHIRGVETSGVLRTLLERKLVRMVGRKEVPGRPIMYGTTKFFLEHFGLRDLSELPPLREFKELGESEQVFLPVDDEPLSVSREGSDQPHSPEDAPQPVPVADSR
jgi:segregation and condensation protein B